MSEFEYNLILEFDVINDQYAQWFFFRVNNFKKGINNNNKIPFFNRKKKLFKILIFIKIKLNK